MSGVAGDFCLSVSTGRSTDMRGSIFFRSTLYPFLLPLDSLHLSLHLSYMLYLTLLITSCIAINIAFYKHTVSNIMSSILHTCTIAMIDIMLIEMLDVMSSIAINIAFYIQLQC